MRTTLSLLALGLAGMALHAQQLPPTPEQALRALPIAAPLQEGIEIIVRNGELGMPAPGANVFVVSENATAAQRNELERRLEAWGPRAAGRRIMLAQASVFGTRYQTDQRGRAKVPLGSVPVVLFGDGFLWGNGRPGEAITVFQPRVVPVRVLDHRGRPAHRVPLVLKRLDEAMATQMGR